MGSLTPSADISSSSLTFFTISVELFLVSFAGAAGPIFAGFFVGAPAVLGSN